MHNKPIEIEYFHALTGKGTSGRGVIPSGTLELRVNGEIIRVSGEGRGPIHAVYNAIDGLPIFDGVKPYLMSFDLTAVKQGADSAGTARARVIFGEKIYEGVGRSEDVIEAAAQAYIDAINKYLIDRSEQQKDA
ncbi:hypothetical protein HYY71_00230 [Candidatus Woesearchaeota archaeon]|nr:hypothetical protein [Candidatus Woesearchaeota archaeon]